MATLDADRRQGFLCPECRLLVSAPTEHLGATLSCPCCHTKLKIPRLEDSVLQLGASARSTQGVSFRADSAKKNNASWHENVPLEYQAEHSSGLPWHMLVPAALLGIILFAGMVHLLFQTEERPVTTLEIIGTQVLSTEAGSATDRSDSNIEEIAKVKDYLNALSGCATVDELEPLLRPVDRLHEKLSSFYSVNTLSFKKIRSVEDLFPVPDVDGGYLCSFTYVDGNARRGVLIENKGQIQLDWESFVGYSDVPWDQLKSILPREPVTVRVIRSVAEYYNHGFNSETYQCFELTRNDSNTRFYAYARRDGVVLNQLLPLGVSPIGSEMTIKVCYPEDVVDDNLLIINSVESGSWIVDYKK